MNKIFIIDGHDRRALASVRSLGKEGHFEVHVGSSRKINATRFSKYCHSFTLYPDPKVYEASFLDTITNYINRVGINVLIPMDDNMAELVARHQTTIRERTKVKILIPTWDIFNIARDKALTLQQAANCGIPVPKSYTIEQALSDPNLQYPLIIKPRISSASIGMVVVKNKQELVEVHDKINAKFPFPLIQEKIPSGGHFQANVVFDRNSELVCSSVKHKIREFPLSGGPSTFFKTVDKPIIEENAVRLLKSIGWVGPAEVEFMIDPRNGNPVLMEINPRMSATIVLSCYAGVDFPSFIVNSLLSESSQPALRNSNYDYFCQWLIPGDLLNFVFNKDRFKQEHGYFFKKPRHLCHMTFRKDDLKPFVFNTVALGIAALSPKKIFNFIKRG